MFIAIANVAVHLAAFVSAIEAQALHRKQHLHAHFHYGEDEPDHSQLVMIVIIIIWRIPTCQNPMVGICQ